jgi:hypothetical protein
MSSDNVDTGDDVARNWQVQNYCVAFFDLLGQRVALEGQGVLKPFASDGEREAFHRVLRNSIRPIIKLQESAETLMTSMLRPNKESRLRASLSPDEQKTWDEMQATTIGTQRWSDGLITFSSLGDATMKCRTNSIFGMLSVAGCLCLMGLATKNPIRAGIEVAWAVEIHPGELSGAALARAYELESEVAKYPRVVVGPEIKRYLELHAGSAEQDVFSQLDHDQALLCLSMLKVDTDGATIVDYLGSAFSITMPSSIREELVSRALRFVNEQLAKHNNSGDNKLVDRYQQLLSYFELSSDDEPQQSGESLW